MLEKIRNTSQKYKGLFVSLSFLLCLFVFSITYNNSLENMTIQSIVLAALAVILLYFYHPKGLAWKFNEKDSSVRLVVVFLIVLAFFVSVLALVQAGKKDVYQLEGWPYLLVLLVVMCMGTSVFEEALFRGVLYQALADHLSGIRHHILIAAVISSCIFGVLHVGAVSGGSNSIKSAQIALRFVQASSFGFCMATLYEEYGSIWMSSLVHFLYNLLTMAPLVVFLRDIPGSYCTGQLDDLVFLAVSFLLIVPPLIGSVRILRRKNDRPLNNLSDSERKRL